MPRLPALALVAAILIYDAWHKGNPLAPFVMGLCRALVYVGTWLRRGAPDTASILGAAARPPRLRCGTDVRGQGRELSTVSAILVAACSARGAGRVDAGYVLHADWLVTLALAASLPQSCCVARRIRCCTT